MKLKTVYNGKKKSPKSEKNKTIKPKGPPRKRTSNDPLTREESETLIRSIDNLQDRTLIFLGLNSGMRVSEIASIEEISIDFQEERVRIWDEKKDLYREVYVNRDVLSSMKLFINSIRGRKDPRIFPVSEKTIERIIQKWTLKALGRKKSWHMVRHTYISLSREMNIPMEIVIQNTGDTPGTILQYYSKPSPEFIRKTVNERRLYEIKG
ncbi:MAG: site-specific integrase [Candidatus Thermoplasmatota archaeon]|nr:site-specific integrase [Candidatus Thermoplasmatota archaeon]